MIGTDQGVIWRREHIFGYAIFNEMTARSAQTTEMGGQFSTPAT